ncbi:MAG: hypothetical protein PQJ58_17470 [Spirochaetales bacterium]|nr:hypothetical protein [Spirochaetales bacterium]
MLPSRSISHLIFISLFIAGSVFLSAQDQPEPNAETTGAVRSYGINYNEKYRSPIAVDVEYQSIRPMSISYDEEYRINDFNLRGIYSFKFMPQLQPYAGLGIQLVAPLKAGDTGDAEKFSHNIFYGVFGASYIHKFSKQLEAGGDLYLGLGQALYPNIDTLYNETRGAMEFLAGIGGSAAFNISYNFSLNFHPTLRYRRSFSTLERFNGFSFGLGFGVAYRTGTDPDDPKAEIKSIRFGEFDLPPMFASMQSYYSSNPIGTIELTNTEKFPIHDVNINFMQAGFMDAPTKADSIAEIGPGESVDVDIYAAYNQEVFSIEGISPLTAELSIDYSARGNTGRQMMTVSYDLHDKESLTWDDDRKMAAYITPSDSALRNYASFVRQSARDVVNPGLNESLQVGLQMFYGLTEVGCIYQKDPTSPFDAAQENPFVIDKVSLPRNTLKRGTGDCDDLTALYCSLLESVGIETAFITTPGHIYAAFNTKEEARNYQQIHPDKTRTLNIEGELWVPVEITLIGTSGFEQAWEVGADEFNKYENETEKRGLYRTRDAQQVFRPVGLKETDLGLQYGEKASIARAVDQATGQLVNKIIAYYDQQAREKDSKSGYNRLGTICTQFGEYNRAEQAFNYALALDRNYLPSKVNLANIMFLKGQYQNALRLYHNVEQDYLSRSRTSSAAYARVVLNLSRCYYELQNFDKSADYANQLKELDPGLLRQYSYLTEDGAGASAAEG